MKNQRRLQSSLGFLLLAIFLVAAASGVIVWRSGALGDPPAPEIRTTQAATPTIESNEVPTTESNEVPSDIRQRVLADFGAENGDTVYRYLLDRIPEGLPNGTRPRHLRCILYLAKGDRALLDRSIEMCLQDTRDVMLNAEYESGPGSELVQVRDFAKPFDQSQIQARKANGAD